MAEAFGLLRCSTESARPSSNHNKYTTQSSSTSQPQSATEAAAAAAAAAATTATSSSFVARAFFLLNSRLVPPLSYLGVAAPRCLSSATFASTASLSNPIELRDLRVSHFEQDSEWAEKSIESFVEKTSEKADENITKEELPKGSDLNSLTYTTVSHRINHQKSCHCGHPRAPRDLAASCRDCLTSSRRSTHRLFSTPSQFHDQDRAAVVWREYWA